MPSGELDPQQAARIPHGEAYVAQEAAPHAPRADDSGGLLLSLSHSFSIAHEPFFVLACWSAEQIYPMQNLWIWICHFIIPWIPWRTLASLHFHTVMRASIQQYHSFLSHKWKTRMAPFSGMTERSAGDHAPFEQKAAAILE